MVGYQLKLDFGEGIECQAEYEKFLEINEVEDSPETWDMFCNIWKRILVAEAMMEKAEQVIQ